MEIIESLAGYYDRLASNARLKDQMPPPGYIAKYVKFEAVFSADGSVKVDEIGVDGKKHPGHLHLLPNPEPRAGGKAYEKPAFLWDNSKFVFGLTNNIDKKTNKPKDVTNYFENFKDFHIDHLANVNEPVVSAFLKFLNNWHCENPTSDIPEKCLDMDIIFRLDTEREYLHEKQFGKVMWDNIRTTDPKYVTHCGDGICMSTGKRGLISRTHPAIKNMGRNANSAGAMLVSFNKNMHKKFDREQGSIGPVLDHIAFKYGAALNYLTASSNKIWNDYSTTVFWAEVNNEDVENGISQLTGVLDEKDLVKFANKDIGATKELRRAMKQYGKSVVSHNVTPTFRNENTTVNILELAPANARLSVVGWHRGAFGNFAQAFSDYADGLDLKQTFKGKVELVWKNVPGLRALMYHTVETDGKISQELESEVRRSVLNGSEFPDRFTDAILHRMRSEKILEEGKNGRKYLTLSFVQKVSICKGHLLRKQNISRPMRLEQQERGYLMELEIETTEKGYLLGRMFACFQYAESCYIERNTSVTDRFYGSASTNPAEVWPELVGSNGGGFRYNVDQVKKRSEKSFSFVEQVQRDISKMYMHEHGSNGNGIPHIMTLDDQCWFALGYDHQMEMFYRKKNKPTDSNEGTN